MSDFYTGGGYSINVPSMHVEHSPWKVEQIIKIIRKNNITQINSIADVGCGAGEVLNGVSKYMPSEVKYFGYEISPDAYNMCLKIKNDRILFSNKDILKEDGYIYDVVMSIDVIEHIEDYMGFLRKLKTKGRWFIFHIPLEISMNTAFRTKALLKGRKSVGHIHYFTKDTAIAALEDTGYKIVDYFYTAGLIEFANLKRVRLGTKILKIPRLLLFLLNQDLAVKTLGGFSLLVLAK